MKINKRKFRRENSPGFIIHRLDSLLKLALHRAFQAQGFKFTPEQWGVLFRLYESDGIHQSELGARAGKDRHNITRILNLMEKKGYIRRVSDEHDKRRYKVFLTEKMREIEDKLTTTVIDFLEKVFCGLTPEEIMQMQKLHLQIIENTETLLKENRFFMKWADWQFLMNSK
ncbi:MAG: MarR family transcriptional regulator [Pseudomonadota bacterium]